MHVLTAQVTKFAVKSFIFVLGFFLCSWREGFFSGGSRKHVTETLGYEVLYSTVHIHQGFVAGVWSGSSELLTIA